MRETVYGQSMDSKHEVASVTKTMTAYTVTEIARKYRLNLSEVHIKVCDTVEQIIGTSAKLVIGDVFTAEQLLYGLMLPSGNDAAFVLAKHFGKFLFEKKQYNERHKTQIKSYEFDNHSSYVKYFLKEMNETASQLKMTSTIWDTPHGMANSHSFTTVGDLFKLCERAIKVDLLHKVMKTKIYTCTSMEEDGNGNLQEGNEYTWVCSNRLLGVDGMVGIKTGWTPVASHCLAQNFQRDGHNYIVITIQSKSRHHLWIQIQQLINWAIWKKKQLQSMKQNPKPPNNKFINQKQPLARKQ